MPTQTAPLSAEAVSVVRAFTDTATRAVVHVPSSAIAPMIWDLLGRSGKDGVPEVIGAGREEEAVGIAGAMNLVGHRSVILMQDNGFGNALTAIATWAVAYHLPLPIFANARGGLGEYNSMIHTISGPADALLGTIGVPVFGLDHRDDADAWHDVSIEAIGHAWLTRRPVVVMMNLWRGGGGT